LHPKPGFRKFFYDNELWILPRSLAAPQQRDTRADSQDLTAIDAQLGRSEVARWHAVWLRDHPEDRIVDRELTLEKEREVHDDLRAGGATTPFAADDVAAALAHACTIRRWYYIAWQHPQRRGEEEIDLYDDLLPVFRREEYEIRRTQPGISDCRRTTRPRPSSPSRASCALRTFAGDSKRPGQARPGAVARLERRLQQQVMRDLYAYGNHPELRFCTAIAPWHRLAASGHWGAAVESAYRNRLFES
jgi:hypothetical protein